MFKKLLIVLSMLVCVADVHSQTWTVGTGTGTNANNGFPTPFGEYNPTMRLQYLYLAGELTSLTPAMTAGLIHKLGFNVTALNAAGVLNSYTIYLKNTTSTVLGTTFETGAIQVYTVASYQPVTGWNTFTLSTPFNWDGTSNVLVEICFWNNNSFTNNPSVQYTTTSYVAAHNYTVATGTANYCGASGNTSTYSQHANIQFIRLPACSGTPAPGNTISSFAAVCSSGTVNLSLQNASQSGLTFQWQSSPNNNTWTDISGATSSTYTATITASTYFRCNVTCSNSSQSTYSNPTYVTLASGTSSYTAPANSACSSDYISKVVFGNINNTSACGNSTTGYSNYNCVGAPGVTPGQSYPLAVTTGGGFAEYTTVWIDYNRNNVFDAGESQFIGSGTNATVTGSITIPGSASAGITGMRIRTSYNSAATGPYTALPNGDGETEDYLIKIGVSAPAVTANQNPICSGQTLILTASSGGSGLSYVWTGPNNFNDTGATITIANITSANAGTYSAKAINGTDTSLATPITITVNPSPAGVTANNSGPICAGNTLNLTGSSTTSGVTYSWTGPNSFTSTSQNPSITNATTAASGTYTVSVSASGCTTTATTTASVTAAPSSISAGSNSPVCAGNTLNIFCSSAGNGVNYSWTGPNSFTSTSQTPSISNATVAASGTYNVVASLNGCSSTANTTVAVNASPASVTANNNGPLCAGNTLNLTGSSSTTGITYSWSGPNSFNSTSQNPSITNATTAASGTYTLTVSNGGCSATATTTASVTAAPATIMASSNSPLCSGNTLNLQCTNAGSGVNYLWTGPNSFTSASQNPSITNATTATVGTYTVVASLNGCSSTSNTTVTVNQSPAAVTAGNNGPICTGNTLTLAASSATTGVTYSWTGPNSFTATSQNPSISNATTAASGTYTVTVSNGGCNTTATTVVSVTPAPGAITAGSNSPVCSGNTLNLSCTNAGNGINYSWTGPNSFTATSQNPSITNVTAAASGVYNVVASLNGCSSTGSTTVTINASPAGATAANNGPLCAGSNTLNLTSSSTTPGVSYSWAGPNSFISTNQNPSITNVTTAASGTYTVTVSNGTCATTATTIVTVSQTPQNVTASTNSPVCLGDTVKLFGNSATTGVTYSWMGPNSFTSSIQNPILANSTAAAAGTYSLVVSQTGCSNTAGTNVVINPAPANLTAANNGPICAGAALNLTGSSTTTGVSYSWTGPNSFTSANQNPSITNATTAASGTYTITATLGSCNKTATTIASVTSSPTGVTATSNSPICTGDTLKLIGGSTTTGVTYDWSGPSFASNIQSPKIPNCNTTASGVYTLNVSKNGCTTTATTTVVVTPPFASVTAANSGPVCSGNILNLTGNTTSTGVTYSWSGPNGFTSSSQNPAINNVITAGGGIYTFTISAGSCTASATTTATVNQTPAATATSNSVVCVGDTLKLFGNTNTTGVSYTWAGPNGFTSGTKDTFITNTTTVATGIYHLVVTKNSCSKHDSTSAIVAVYPVINLGNDTIICANTSIILTAGVTTPGYTFLWNTTDTIPAITVQNMGTYIVKVTNLQHCFKRDTIVVTTVPVPVVHLGNDTLICHGTSFTLNAGNAGSNYNWNTGATTQTITVNVPGSYSVIVASANNCKGSDTINIGDYPMPHIDSISWFHITNDSVFVFVMHNPQYVLNKKWYFGDGSSDTSTIPTHTFGQGGTFSVKLVLFGRCGSDTFTVKVQVGPTGIKEWSNRKNAFHIYPNPTSDFVTVENMSNINLRRVVILNDFGAVVQQETLRNEKLNTISLKDLASGYYMLLIKTDEGIYNYKLELLK